MSHALARRRARRRADGRSRRGRTCCSSWRSCSSSRRAARAAVRGRADRLARARLRRARRAVRAHPAVGGSAAARPIEGVAVRRAPRPAARRRVLPRPRARADAQGARVALHVVLATAAFVAAFGLSTSMPSRSRGGALGGPAGSAPARPRLPRPVRAAGELRLQRGDNVIFRRLTSTFLSPLATSTCSSSRCSSSRCGSAGAGSARASLLFVGLLWTHTRSALLALVVGPARARRRPSPPAPALCGRRRGGRRARLRPGVRPLRARRALHAAELVVQKRNAPRAPRRRRTTRRRRRIVDERAPGELRDGARDGRSKHPWGFGLGNSGVTAARTHVRSRPASRPTPSSASRSALLGGLVFAAWSLALLRATLGVGRGSGRRSPPCSSSGCRPT